MKSEIPVFFFIYIFYNDKQRIFISLTILFSHRFTEYKVSKLLNNYKLPNNICV